MARSTIGSIKSYMTFILICVQSPKNSTNCQPLRLYRILFERCSRVDWNAAVKLFDEAIGLHFWPGTGSASSKESRDVPHRNSAAESIVKREAMSCDLVINGSRKGPAHLPGSPKGFLDDTVGRSSPMPFEHVSRICRNL